MITRERLFFLAFLKVPAGAAAALKRLLRFSAPTERKIGSGSGAASKLRLRLCNTGRWLVEQSICLLNLLDSRYCSHSQATVNTGMQQTVLDPYSGACR